MLGLCAPGFLSELRLVDLAKTGVNAMDRSRDKWRVRKIGNLSGLGSNGITKNSKSLRIKFVTESVLSSANGILTIKTPAFRCSAPRFYTLDVNVPRGDSIAELRGIRAHNLR